MENVQSWLEERQLTDRWKQPIGGFLNLILVFAVFIGLWYVFMDTRGIFRLYTPLYGFMWISWILLVTVWHVYLFQYWPFKNSFLEKQHPVIKGVVMTASILMTTWIIISFFFANILGKLSIPYFSIDVLTELGIGSLIAREYASLAVLMVAVVGTWVSFTWPVAFGRYPWNGLSKSIAGFSIWIWTTLLSVIAFFLLLHPHFGVMFYPWQKFAAAFPWWQSYASTLHGNFTIGFIMTITAITILTETIWERKPWSLVKNQPWQGFIIMAGIFVLSLITFNTFLFIQDIMFGLAVPGAQRIMAPNWRFLHAGEMTMFMLVVGLVLYFYFNNWPRHYSTEVNWLIRTAITLVGGTFLYSIYYKISPSLLGTVAGKSDPNQFPIAALMLFIAVMAIHHWYFDNWPGDKSSLKTNL